MKTDSLTSSILVKINGEDKLIPQNISILKLIEMYKLTKDRVVIEVNKNILKKDQYETTNIKSNDEVEIVTFVGGG